MKNNTSAFSLVEILVVISVFAVLGVLITRSVLLTLSGGQKSESLISVRDNLNYSVGVIERQLRNANSITDCGSATPSAILYSDQNGNPASFSCVNVKIPGAIGYIASGAAKLTDSSVNITNCSFECTQGITSPSTVTIFLEAVDASASGIENSDVTTSTQVLLRNY